MEFMWNIKKKVEQFKKKNKNTKDKWENKKRINRYGWKIININTTTLYQI